MKTILMLSLVLFSLSAFSETYDVNLPLVIYGEDDRHDGIAYADPVFVRLADSTAGMISPANLKYSGDTVEIDASSFQRRMGMCASERFSQQPAAANCSGFLVGKDLLVTAGHCIESQLDCDSYLWVFNYEMNRRGSNKIALKTSDVYKCSEIIERKLVGVEGAQNDYALIRLEREVKGVKPLKIRQESDGELQVGEELVVIGHPSGLPTKITDGAIVRSRSEKFFSANLDTYGGNSGSAVFNGRSGLVEGILVRGARDYIWDYQENCRVSNIVADDFGGGEEVTYITNIDFLKNL